MTRYIGLLRGINVGGNKKIKMADLRALMGELGFANIKTALASGNVAWDSDDDDMESMREAIMAGIKATFGFDVPLIVFPRQQVEEIVASAPFDGRNVTDDTRLYVTFLPAPVTTALDIPHQSMNGDFVILRVTDTDVCSVLTITHARSVDAMTILETEFGKTITTRNWNTVLKLVVL